MEISTFLTSWCNAFGNISPIHFSPLIPVACLQRRITTFQDLLLLQAAGLGTRGWSQQWIRGGCSSDRVLQHPLSIHPDLFPEPWGCRVASFPCNTFQANLEPAQLFFRSSGFGSADVPQEATLHLPCSRARKNKAEGLVPRKQNEKKAVKQK